MLTKINSNLNLVRGTHPDPAEEDRNDKILAEQHALLKKWHTFFNIYSFFLFFHRLPFSYWHLLHLTKISPSLQFPNISHGALCLQKETPTILSSPCDLSLGLLVHPQRSLLLSLFPTTLIDVLLSAPLLAFTSHRLSTLLFILSFWHPVPFSCISPLLLLMF